MSTVKNLGPFRIRPRGEYLSDANYRFLDLVSYNGGSYLCSNYDTIDGTACIGIAPSGNANSETYWMCIAERGEAGIIKTEYIPIKNLEGNVWDFNATDKIYIDKNFNQRLEIINVQSGQCGVILTDNPELKLPMKSDYSIDFNYVTISSNQYYLYTFIYANIGFGDKFIWNRSVINKS